MSTKDHLTAEHIDQVPASFTTQFLPYFFMIIIGHRRLSHEVFYHRRRIRQGSHWTFLIPDLALTGVATVYPALS